MTTSKTTLKRIEPLSAGKILAGIYGVFGLILGVIYFFIILAIATAAGAASNYLWLGLIGGLIGGLVAAALITLFYAGIGFIAGLISAAIYNVAAHKLGGLQIETETTK